MAAPRKGQTGLYKSPQYGLVSFKVLRVDGPYCHCQYSHMSEPSMFIWKLADGPNEFHNWPGRSV